MEELLLAWRPTASLHGCIHGVFRNKHPMAFTIANGAESLHTEQGVTDPAPPVQRKTTDRPLITAEGYPSTLSASPMTGFPDNVPLGIRNFRPMGQSLHLIVADSGSGQRASHVVQGFGDFSARDT
jgi:hypothetical protein